MQDRLKILLVLLVISILIFSILVYQKLNVGGYFNGTEKAAEPVTGQQVTSQKSNINISNVQISKTAPASPQNTQSKFVGEVGQEFDLSNFRYEVISATNKGNQYKYSKTDGKYIEVILSAENIGKTSAKPHTIGIFDSEDRQYGASQFVGGFDDGTYEAYSKYTMLADTIKPGFTSTLRAVFEVSVKSTGLRLIFADSDGKVIHYVNLEI